MVVRRRACRWAQVLLAVSPARLEESWAPPWEVSEAVGLRRSREERRRVRRQALVVVEVVRKLRLPLQEVACQEFLLQA